MVTVDIYYSREESDIERADADSISGIQTSIANILSCSDKQLDAGEVSVRIIRSNSSTGMLEPFEVSITSHNYAELMQKKDEICKEIRSYFATSFDTAAKVWLKLCWLGYSG